MAATATTKTLVTRKSTYAKISRRRGNTLRPKYVYETRLSLARNFLTSHCTRISAYIYIYTYIYIST